MEQAKRRSQQPRKAPKRRNLGDVGERDQQQRQRKPGGGDALDQPQYKVELESDPRHVSLGSRLY